MARVDRAAKGGEGAVGGQLPTAAARLTSTGVPWETSKRCTLIELSTLGARTTTAGPVIPNEPPLADRLERNQRPQSDQAMAAKLIRALIAGRAASDVIVLQDE